MLRGISQASLMGGPGLPPGVVLAIPVTEASGAPGAFVDGSPVAGSNTVGSTGRETVDGVFGATFASAVVGYGDVTMLDGANAATWVVSIRPDNLTQTAGVLNKRAAATSQNAYSIGLNYTPGNLSVEIGDASGAASAYAYRFDRSGLGAAAYQQLIITFDNSAPLTERIKAWRNNTSVALITAFTDSPTPIAIPNTTAPLELGRVNNATLYYSGGIAYAYAWRRALDAAERAAVWDVLGAGDKTRPTQ